MSKEVSKQELMTCPWCGSAGQIRSYGFDRTYVVGCSLTNQHNCINPTTAEFMSAESAVVSWNTRYDSTQQELGQLRSIVKDLTDEDDCMYDHHGYCQAHGWLDTTPCPQLRIRRLRD